MRNALEQIGHITRGRLESYGKLTTHVLDTRTDGRRRE